MAKDHKLTEEQKQKRIAEILENIKRVKNNLPKVRQTEAGSVRLRVLRSELWDLDRTHTEARRNVWKKIEQKFGLR